MSEQQGHEQQDPKQEPPQGYPHQGHQQQGPPQGPPPGPQPGYQQEGYQQEGYQQQGYPPPGYPPPGFPPPGYYPPPGTYTGDPNAPYGYDPYGRPYSDKSKIIAGILQLTLGGFGVGRFYLGNVGMGLAQLFTCGGLGVWSLVDGILLLTGNDHTDEHGRILRS
ncbi:TM2 domain-containing protein [Streptomyces griseorubiginosus]|uniref:TM2 domain-containing protein n=1 Tax=Streptomyces griseorubiginosus TaxID=67304 RepID=UPI002E8080AD|nr:TM2 domain-containing protein [Streptomyces griseorubiginosus]WUB44783.1 TM2 domain-containing protein [Streptomyces griseorubiginosus]WUB53300.1 TM2 domain-containing protein [Streptomyces griseorubiginosus]